ncbi:expressed unknown protein [Seminavis robusta]|uniref:Uncharacterized protein n=1 Tax=Seminavis robusta TaxID=568900 RepID=A0A9N8DUC9_9STRA|nr:expressed unknown protein [Seminavis robusta]|eukprot:Sro357_g125560.1 n/a (199) ;mRNA; f:17181-17874
MASTQYSKSNCSMWKQLLVICSLVLWCSDHAASAFSLRSSVPPSTRRIVSLAAARQPRRNLKKRKGRDRKSPSYSSPSLQDQDDGYEVKPLISYQRKEAGEDFWIDPEDLRREKERERAISNRKAMEGEMSKEKLISEVVAPYKQNWIGIMSMVIVVLAAIVTNFPEVLENPSINFPDLDSGDPIPMETTLKSVVLDR